MPRHVTASTGVANDSERASAGFSARHETFGHIGGRLAKGGTAMAYLGRREFIWLLGGAATT
jgi:hypothetical protein